MKSIILGTAGHIDHGKSALVRALTGKDPDRLPEEKRRGITIDLGFADLDLGDVKVAFVDVPGHERFVKNMLAGAHGVDAVALVIAADEGVMPQTREHFDICRLLGVQNGLIVITKIDLAEEELLPLVRAEANELVAGSFLEGAPIVSVSARTGVGLDELKEALRKVASQTFLRPAYFVTRLPVDRAFTMKGFGAVVTGTLVSGEIVEGDELELLPGGLPVRARGLQVHGKTVNRAAAGQRTAVNLGGVELSAIERGMMLAPIGRLKPTQMMDVQLEVLPGAARPLRSRTRVRFHIHAAEVLGRVRVLNEASEIAPGQTGFAQISLELPVIAVAQERFIIRSYAPSQTIAGGEVLDPFALKHRAKDLKQITGWLQAMLGADGTARISAFIQAANDQGLRLAELTARTGWSEPALRKVCGEALEQGVIKDCEGILIASANFQRLSDAAVAEVKAHHLREPLAKGLGREILRERVFGHTPQEVFRTVLRQLEQGGTLVAEKDMVRSSEHKPQFTGVDAKLRDLLESIYEKAGLEPPSLNEAIERAGVAGSERTQARKVMQHLLDEGAVVRIEGDLCFARRRLEALKKRVQDYGDDHEPSRTIDVATFKNLAGVSRKYAIPLMEYLDRERITRRQGDQRIILKPARGRRQDTTAAG